MSIITVAVIETVSERGVKCSLHVVLGMAFKRLLGLDLAESVLHRGSLHVMKNTLLSDGGVGAHWGWGHVSVGHGRLNWQRVLSGKSLSGGTDQGGDWDLLGDGNQAQEVMLEHVLNVGSLRNVNCKAFADEVLGVRTKLDMLREAECASTNLLVGVLDFLGLERRSAIKHGVENDTDGPVINLVTMATVLFEDLRGKVVWRSANSALLLALVKDLGGKAEISNLKLHVLVKEEVAQLEIAMDNFARMNVLNTLNELVDVVASLDFVQALASLDHVRKGLV